MIHRAILRRLLDAALEEDLNGGDITSALTVPKDQTSTATATAKSELVVCGEQVFREVMLAVDASLSVTTLTPDGTLATTGTKIWTVQGNTQSLLAAERTALNFVQRMSGIATESRRYQGAVPKGSTTRVADTRKTTPLLRALERYAVRTGGAYNHRDCLGSAVMIKDNHIKAAGGISAAVRGAKARAPHTSKIEVEVESLEGLEEALTAGAEIVMLDNFDGNQIEEAVARCRERAIVEVSGGITLERIATLATQGVDVISVGALTHSVSAADISFNIQV